MPLRHLLTRFASRGKVQTLPRPRRPQCQNTTRTVHTGGDASSTSRVERILSRLPRPLRRYTIRLRNAPLSHIVAFLILHEVTAVVPLVALFGVFHYTEFVPLSYVVQHYGAWVREGAGRFERYFRRKGWFGFNTGEGEGEGARGVAVGDGKEGGDVLRRWEGEDGRYKIVVEVALAYALTKALLPLRIVASVWATPWFAGVLGRLRGLVRLRK